MVTPAPAAAALVGIAQTVAQHYGDDISCAIVIRHADALKVEAQWSSIGITIPDEPEMKDEGFTLFHHHVGRALPIIVDGESEKLDCDPLAKSLGLRFYVASPLIPSHETGGECLGVIAIFGRRHVDTFSLTEADYLMEKAVTVTHLVEASQESE
eukprot:TRINITY_DN40056_c0_g1_i1.p1 TRINITY_DN40056_c0_g1~~TRINITY_DN40056_c0_g1_i1.p1  ORF type:complete len:155 (-),score=23.57 TRINITY_DN40056_c0_g1_i1:3-467(-)